MLCTLYHTSKPVSSLLSSAVVFSDGVAVLMTVAETRNSLTTRFQRRDHRICTFVACPPEQIAGTKSFRMRKKVYGKERAIVVTFNQNLFDTQWLTLQNDIESALQKLSMLRQKLEDRANGIITRGRAPTQGSIEKQCKEFLGRQHMKTIVKAETTISSGGTPQLEYELDGDALAKLTDTYLGKNLIVTSREHWDDAAIIRVQIPCNNP